MSDENTFQVVFGDVDSTESLGAITAEFNCRIGEMNWTHDSNDFSSDINKNLEHFVAERYPEATGIKNVDIKHLPTFLHKNHGAKKVSVSFLVTGNPYKMKGLGES